jgi:hypothetical protein
MKLHEILEINEISTVMRVPGGWNYIVETSNKGMLPHAIASTFVPVPYTEKDTDTDTQ